MFNARQFSTDLLQANKIRFNVLCNFIVGLMILNNSIKYPILTRTTQNADSIFVIKKRAFIGFFKIIGVQNQFCYNFKKLEILPHPTRIFDILINIKCYQKWYKNSLWQICLNIKFHVKIIYINYFRILESKFWFYPAGQ